MSQRYINVFEKYPERIWSTPAYYGGHDPVGELVVATKSRDSDQSAEDNFDAAFEKLKVLNGDSETLEDDIIYIHRTRHWAVGWIEYLMLKKEASALAQESVDNHLQNIES